MPRKTYRSILVRQFDSVSSNAFVASELCMMNISTRKHELTMRWWLRLQKQIHFNANTVVSIVAHHKWRQVLLVHGEISIYADDDDSPIIGNSRGQHSELNRMRQLLIRHGFVD
jgi:hypothetical protein